MPECNCQGGTNCCMIHQTATTGNINVTFTHPSKPKLDPEVIDALAEFGIDYETWKPWEEGGTYIYEVLAAQKFLNAGKWEDAPDGTKIYVVDGLAFKYANGEIDAEEYVNGEVEP